MKVTSAEFIKSAVDLFYYPDDSLPEVAFVGRSNVGKSSLINTLVNRKRLAKTSNTPGRTQLVNFFMINKSLSLSISRLRVREGARLRKEGMEGDGGRVS